MQNMAEHNLYNLGGEMTVSIAKINLFTLSLKKLCT